MRRSKRIRVFAGPNGSGKSTIFNGIRSRFFTGHYVNADEIQTTLRRERILDLADFGVDVDSADPHVMLDRIQCAWMGPGEDDIRNVRIEEPGRVLVHDGPLHYEAAVISGLIRELLLAQGAYFTFETVMSHDSKIDFLIRARNLGYKCYLYFVCTVDKEINVHRVHTRVQQGGHPVEETRIRSRYDRSLGLLRRAIRASYRSFLFDNSAVRDADAGLPDSLPYVEFKGPDIRTTMAPDSVPIWIRQHALDLP